MAECPTNHAYKIKIGPLLYCVSCKQYFDGAQEEKKDYIPCVMPPRVYTITEKVWEKIAPWPLIPYWLVKKYDWYISFLKGSEYLIMPCISAGTSIYFSARKIDDGPGPKYYYQNGAKKEYWLSLDFPSKDILIGEGVADAIYLSQFGSSIAILGSHYNGSLDSHFRDRNVYIVLDSDGAGIAASLCIAAHITPLAKQTKIVMLPTGLDPTDMPTKDLRECIFNA